MIRFITTFNNELHRATGYRLIETFEKYASQFELLIYTEDQISANSCRTKDTNTLPELTQVRKKFSKYIPTEHDFNGQLVIQANLRWFGWFHKVVAQYDAVFKHPIDGYTIFLDADTQFVKPFSPELVHEQATAGINFFRGDRSSVESGIVIWNEKREQAKEFAQFFMNTFLNGDFLNCDRWGDGWILGYCSEKKPECCKDLAHEIRSSHFENSTGHKTSAHVIPFTEWGRYIEHDKGIHGKKGLVPGKECKAAG